MSFCKFLASQTFQILTARNFSLPATCEYLRIPADCVRYLRTWSTVIYALLSSVPILLSSFFVTFVHKRYHKNPLEENRDESLKWNKIKLKAPVIELFPLILLLNVLRFSKMYVFIVIMQLHHVRIVNIHIFYFLVYRPPVALKASLAFVHIAHSCIHMLLSRHSTKLRNNNNNLSSQERESERKLCLCMEINKRAHIFTKVFLTTQQYTLWRTSKQRDENKKEMNKKIQIQSASMCRFNFSAFQILSTLIEWAAQQNNGVPQKYHFNGEVKSWISTEKKM